MIDTIEAGYDDPKLLERISGLMDRGYVVYFGELATAALATATAVPDAYYALVMRDSAHEEQINTTNHIYEAAHVMSQAQRQIYWIPQEPFVPVERFSEKTVLHDSRVQTGDTADMALSKAIRTLRESEEIARPAWYIRPARLRQSHDRCRR